MHRMIGLVLAAISGAILTAPISLPITLLTVAGYVGVAGGIMSAVSQLTVEEHSTSKAEQVKNKSRKRKEVG